MLLTPDVHKVKKSIDAGCFDFTVSSPRDFSTLIVDTRIYSTMAVLVRTCCCGCDLRTGILLIGIFCLVGIFYIYYVSRLLI